MDQDEIYQKVDATLGENVAQRLHSMAAQLPDAVALDDGSRSLTYAELERRTNQIAHALIDTLGVGSEPVALLFTQDIDMLIGVLSVVKAGKAYFPLDEDFDVERLQDVVRTVGPRALLTHPPRQEQATAVLAGHDGTISLLNIEQIAPDLPDTAPDITIDPDDLAVMLFTSGSTGQPKIVQRSHRTMIDNMDNLPEQFKVIPGERVILNMHYSMGWSRATILQTFMFGGTLIPYDMRRHGLSGLAAWLRKTRTSRIQFISSVLRQWMQLADEPYDLPDLRKVLLGGDVLTLEDAERFRYVLPPTCEVYLSLGLSEIGVVTIYVLTHDVEFDGDVVPVGYAIPGREVWIVDDDDQPVLPDQPGEIVVRSETMTVGYVNSNSASRTRFVPDPDDPRKTLLYTGDLGRMTEDGCLTWLGRKDSQVKIRGMNITLDEVEVQLKTLPNIADAAVSSVDGPGGQAQIVAYLERESNSATISDSDMRERLAKSLTPAMIPAYFVWLDRLPRLASGKLDRTSLPELSGHRPTLAESYTPAESVVESGLIAIWQDLLEVSPIGIDDRFFDLGGNSLLASAVVARIEKMFGQTLSMARLSQAPTIRQLARLVEQPDAEVRLPSLVAIQPEGTQRPLFCIHPRGGLVGLYHHLARHLGSDQPVYGLQARGLDGLDEPHRTIAEMAAYYIEQIKTVQPTGPYILAGFSMGGVIAHEMACQMQSAGDDIALLLMIDAHITAPVFRKVTDAVSRPFKVAGTYVRGIGNTLRQMGQQPVSQWLSYLSQRRDQIVSTRDEQRQSQIAAADPFNQAQFTPERRVLWANRLATETHEWHVYDGSAVFFLASQERLGRRSPTHIWGPFIKQGLEVIIVPGTHRSIIEGDDLPVLAAELKRILDQHA